ncbi:MAG: hypothetical protein K0Q94_5309 [Paenibacillus sp.]|nr:hypothetical protein [Paenibacillus sp.]
MFFLTYIHTFRHIATLTVYHMYQAFYLIVLFDIIVKLQSISLPGDPFIMKMKSNGLWRDRQ